MSLTVQELSEVYIQTIQPRELGFHIFDEPKRDIDVPNYFNGGFFAEVGEGKTIPVGNLADSGWIFSQSIDNPDWINVSKKQLTTLYVKKDGSFGILKSDNLETIPNLKTAISGIPIASDGKQVTMEEIQIQGYFGSELYDTWHGFLGLRGDEIVYVAAKCAYEQMFWILRALGIRDALKLDGGGSFILHNDTLTVSTEGNRCINNAGMWEG